LWIKTLIARIGRGAVIKGHAETTGESVSDFINRAISETMARDIEKD
jgi:hypothetical protein